MAGFLVFQSKFKKKFKTNKFNATRSNGFASKLESSLYGLLKIRELSGEISQIRCQDPVELTKGEGRPKEEIVIILPNFLAIINLDISRQT